MSEKFPNNNNEGRGAYDTQQESGVHKHSGCPECGSSEYSCSEKWCGGSANTEKVCNTCWKKNYRAPDHKELNTQIGLTNKERDERLRKSQEEHGGQERRAA